MRGKNQILEKPISGKGGVTMDFPPTGGEQGILSLAEKGKSSFQGAMPPSAPSWLQSCPVDSELRKCDSMIWRTIKF